MDPEQLQRLRSYFPLSQRLAYFNHAAVSPIATPTREAMQELLADVNEFGALHWQAWIAALDRARSTLARLVGASPAEIAFTKNTSEGLATIARGLAWQPGDRVVSFAGEFPANLYPWLALRPQGVRVELLPQAALLDFEALRRACRGARVLSVSFVQYLSGFRADLAAIGQICRETRTLFVVDAIQGLGAFPLDAKRCGIHALAADGHKWLTGPEGAGLLFVDAVVVDQITPPEVGWLSVAAWEDFSAPQAAASSPAPLAWRPGAARFECGTLNTVGIIGLAAAVELLLSVGIETIAEHILALGQQLAQGLRQQGCELLNLSDDAASRSGITSFRHPRMDANAVVAQLEAQGILCASRGGWVRCAPHLYNTPAEVARLLEAVGRCGTIATT